MLVEAVAATLGATAAQKVAQAIVRTLASKEAADVLARVAEKDLPPAATAVIRWLVAKRTGLPLGPPELNQIGVARAPDVAAAIAASTAASGKPGSVLFGQGDNVHLLPADQRASYGVAKIGNEISSIVVLAAAEAEQLAEHHGGNARVVGFGTADLPPVVDADDAAIQSHRPGRSVAHNQGFAGSLGLYVTFRDQTTKRSMKGFVGAAHVLGNLGDAKVGDAILSPGPPPEDFQDVQYSYGRFVRGRMLRHHGEQTDLRREPNACDVALAALIDATTPCENAVPDPRNPAAARVQIHDAVSSAEMPSFLSQDVFLVGRTTPFSHGTLSVVAVREFPIRMPNWKNYIFKDLCVIQRFGSAPFSRPGDSGALVYVQDGNRYRALGFVVGGNDLYSFVTPASTCLELMKAQPYVQTF